MNVSDASRPVVGRSGQDHTQKRFDFNRAAKLGMLDRVMIPIEALETHREQIGPVRGLLLRVKALLRAIESFAGNDSECWASIEQIGKRMGCNARTTQRYLIVAKLFGLVTVIPGRHHTTSIHDICWGRVWEWSQPTSQANEGRQQRDEGRHERGSGVTTTSVRGDSPVTQIAMTRPEAQIKTPSNPDGFLRFSKAEGKQKPLEGGHAKVTKSIKQPSDTSAQSVPRNGGWSHSITREMLNTPEQIETLYQEALSLGWIDAAEATRNRFFTLAAYCHRRSSLKHKLERGWIEDAGAVFTVNLHCKNWRGSIEDEETARRWLHPAAYPRTSDLALEGVPV